MKKRILTMALALAMSVTCMTGCKEKQTASNNSEYPERLELTVWDTQGTDYVAPPEIENNIVENWLIDKTNVKVENIYGNDGGQWDPKLTKLVAGNNLPDIVSCGAGQGAAHFARLKELGVLYELTPEDLQTYAPEIWKQIDEKTWDLLTVDGKIMGIPYNYRSEAIVNGSLKGYYSEEDINFLKQYGTTVYNDVLFDPSKVFWIRDDILKMLYPEAKGYNELVALLEEKNEPIGEELLDIPVYSTDDYIEMMYKINELKLTSNGKKVYAFGYNGGDNWLALTYLGADMYGYKGYNYCSWWNDAEKKIEIPLVHDIIKQASATQNKMIRDGVIDPESLAHTQNNYTQKILNGQYAIIPPGYLGLSINKELENLGVEYRYRPLYTQVPAQPGLEMGKCTNTAWGEALCLTTRLSEEEMHQVLNWLNVQFSDEYQEIKAWGPKDAGLYTEDESGKRTFNDDRFNKYYIEGDATALEPSETFGIGGPALASYDVGLFSVNPGWKNSRWEPSVNNRFNKLRPSEASGFGFKIDSPHVTSVKEVPVWQIWAADFAQIPEVVTYWGAREQWESKFKIAFSADSDEQFEVKWQEAVDLLNEIVDVNTLEKKMTEVALGKSE